MRSFIIGVIGASALVGIIAAVPSQPPPRPASPAPWYVLDGNATCRVSNVAPIYYYQRAEDGLPAPHIYENFPFDAGGDIKGVKITWNGAQSYSLDMFHSLDMCNQYATVQINNGQMVNPNDLK